MNACWLQNPEVLVWIIPAIVLSVTWELVWKLLALWKAARNNNLGWFICLALLNTVGILPIMYILMNRKKETAEN